MGKFIDMDKLVLPKGTVNRIQERGVPAILDWLAEQESIDIVRCKDCIYRRQVTDAWFYCEKIYSNMSGLHKRVDDDFYCKDGERIEIE